MKGSEMRITRSLNLLVVPSVVIASVLLTGCGGGKAAVTTTTTSSTTTTTLGVTTTGAPNTGDTALSVPVSGSGGFNYTQGSYLEGFEFTAVKPISVTELGAYDSNLSALSNGSESFATVPVALYDMSTHKSLAVVNVSASDPATGVYRYVALSTPVALNTSDTYAVAWVSLSNYYVASPKLVASDVNSSINYVAMAGNGGGGLTMTTVMLEPNWFYPVSAHGLSALNYDLGPNFKISSAS